jgi:Flp pilus assembly pilin Flp
MHIVWEGCAGGTVAVLGFFAQNNRNRDRQALGVQFYLVWAVVTEMSWRGRFLRLWCDSAGSSLIEYSFVITVMIALVLIAVATAGVWVAEEWTRLLATLSP